MTRARSTALPVLTGLLLGALPGCAIAPAASRMGHGRLWPSLSTLMGR